MTYADAPYRNLSVSADHLRLALNSDRVVFNSMMGLRHAMIAAAYGQPLDRDLVSEIAWLLFALAPRLAEAVAGRLSTEHIMVGLGSAKNALWLPVSDRRRGLIAYASVVEAELKTIHFREFVEASAEQDLAFMLARNPQSFVQYLDEAPPLH